MPTTAFGWRSGLREISPCAVWSPDLPSAEGRLQRLQSVRELVHAKKLGFKEKRSSKKCGGWRARSYVAGDKPSESDISGATTPPVSRRYFSVWRPAS
jgi:hypothetical protein